MGIQPYGYIKGIGKVKVNSIVNGKVHCTDCRDQYRVVDRARITFLKSKKPNTPKTKPAKKPTYEQGELFKRIVKEDGGYAIYSSSGNKRLMKPGSLEQAKKRLKQIEYFKHQDVSKALLPTSVTTSVARARVARPRTMMLSQNASQSTAHGLKPTMKPYSAKPVNPARQIALSLRPKLNG